MTLESNVADIKRRFSEVLNRVALNRERVIIHRRGKRVAVLVPVDEVALDTGDENRRQRRGLVAAVGAWEGYEDTDDFIDEINRLRDRAADREPEPLP